jgi:hypothetical protein
MLKAQLLLILILYGITLIDGLVLFGGRKEIDLRDPDVYEQVYNQAIFAAKEYTRVYKSSLSGKCSTVAYSPITILQATLQIVSGFKYYLKVEIQDENCQYECAVLYCDFVTWLQAGANGQNLLISHDCKY